MVSDQPSGWAIAPIQELCAFNPKHDRDTPPDGPISFVPMAAVSDEFGRIDAAEERTFGEVRRGYTHFADGDVIWAKITPCMENGKSAVAEGLTNGMACGSTEFMVLRSQGAVQPVYLHRFLRQESYRREARQTMKSGVGQARVPKTFVLETRLPVPPLNEQKRIVAKLETLQARTEAAKAALDAIPPLLDKFRQSVLAAAFRGDLTKAWRAQNPGVEPASVLLDRIRAERRIRWIEDTAEKVRARTEARAKKAGKPWLDEHDAKVLEREQAKAVKKYKAPQPVDTEDLPELPVGWCWTNLGELSASLSYGTARKSLTEGQIPVLRMGNLQNGEVCWSNLKYSNSDEDNSKYALSPGSILFNRTNSPELVGKTAIYRGKRPAIYAGYLIRVNLASAAQSEFINLLLNSPLARDWCRRVKTDGVSQSNISGSKLATFPVPLCPASEQETLVAFITSRLSIIAKMKTAYESASSQSLHLNQSILAKAFRGKLVPQDPNDEPASVLLERIRAERAQAEAAKPKRRRRKAKTQATPRPVPGSKSK
jgi:type I restriction enzyme S subunit